MAGEMRRIDQQTGEDDAGNVWGIHAAIARDVGGILCPFDTYQGPYISVGPDMRVGDGDPAYHVPVNLPGTIRLWVVSEGGISRVFREDNRHLSPGFLWDDEAAAVDQAIDLIEGGGAPA